MATAKELTRRRKLRVEVDGAAIALFHAGGQVYAFDDVCIHQDRSLFKGTMWQGKVICPGHQWQFDLATGYEEDQDRCQPTYEVRVEDRHRLREPASESRSPPPHPTEEAHS